jgi:tripartite-type tricarboxylate transporter receptor subunit TctC
MTVWAGMQVLRAAPEPVLQRLHQVFQEVTRDAEFRDWARATGTDLVAPLSLAELDVFYQQEVARYQAMAQATPTGS